MLAGLLLVLPMGGAGGGRYRRVLVRNRLYWVDDEGLLELLAVTRKSDKVRVVGKPVTKTVRVAKGESKTVRVPSVSPGSVAKVEIGGALPPDLLLRIAARWRELDEEDIEILVAQ